MNPTPPSLEGLVALAHMRGREAWPGVDLDLTGFVRAVEERRVEAADLLAHGTDLFLAAACGAGIPKALELFEANFVQRVGVYVSKLSLRSDVVDEVQQLVRIRMLTGPAPKIALYAGKGALDAWVRILSIRSALNTLESRKPDQLRRDGGQIEAIVDRDHGDELRYIREHHREAFQAALERSLLALPPREKTLLRMSFVDGHSIDVIGSIYRVHRATVARWLVAIRKRMMDDLRRELAIDLRSSSTEAQSLIKLMWNDVRVSVERLLTPDTDK